MPHLDTVNSWRHSNPKFSDMYALAREAHVISIFLRDVLEPSRHGARRGRRPHANEVVRLTQNRTMGH